MKIMLLFLPVLFAGFGCTTLPSTGYVQSPSPNEDGYYIEARQGGHNLVLYRGNTHTSSAEALSYAMLAAYDYCSQQQKIGWVDTPKNLSTTVTKLYPRYLAIFVCREKFKALAAGVDYQELKPELVRDVTLDYHGGVLVKPVSGGQLRPLQTDDVVIRVNKRRVESTSEISAALEADANSKADVQVIRDHKIVKLNIPVVDFTDEVIKQRDHNISTLCAALPNPSAFSEVSTERPGICNLRLSAAN